MLKILRVLRVAAALLLSMNTGRVRLETCNFLCCQSQRLFTKNGYYSQFIVLLVYSQIKLFNTKHLFFIR